jgi:hypothetical protein
MSQPGPRQPPVITGAPAKELAKTLMGNETILAATQVGASALVATNFRVIITKPAGLFGALTSSYQYQQITSVDMASQLLGGAVVITAAGVRNLGKNNNVAPNVFGFGKFGGKEQEVQYVVAVIRQQIAIAQTQQPTVVQAAPVSQPLASIPEQIKQLAALRDAGVLTPQEFEQKKAELLSRM